ncbi:aldehyde dehydrogenase family protein [Pseudonocardia thermophila]|uniref:aldehyde dehydrogenase family protein n=1 Tax=Pseudonocardia thermophila TaxID=1848 RepID=UPI00248D588A|nr:aldehyde dehydrogenase family protein [Pseudonocardia thermophila]
MTDPATVLAEALPEGLGGYAAGTYLTGRGSVIEVRYPATGELLTTWRDIGAEGAIAAVDAAAAAVRPWQEAGPFGRAEALRRLAVLIRESAARLATLETATAGKPLRDTRVEVARAAEFFDYYAGWADKITGQTLPVPGPWLTYTRRVPYGVIGLLTPWNAPLFTAAWNAAAALACGNTVVLKPSEFTPATTLVLARLAEEAGLPPGALSVACGLGETVGQALVADPRVRKVAFIGSVATGRAVATAAASRGVPALLELGGKSANIVFADADLDTAVNGVLAAIFAGAGQSCVAGSRLLVEAEVHDEFVAEVVRRAALLKVGDPLDPDVEIGPIANARQYSRVCELVEQALSEGAVRVSVPGARDLASGGFWVEPTVLDRVSPDNAVARTEVFGPVLAVSTFTDEADAIRQANDTDFGLAGAVWTSSVERAHRVADAVRAGTFWINAYKTIHVAAPFGGFGDSGWGRSSGPDVLGEYTQAKAVWVPTSPYVAPFPSLRAH